MFTLTQPWATVVAAIAVLLAAGVTYLVGVHNRRQAHLHWTGSDRQQRFLDATRQLADANAAVRIAGVAAIEILADDWLTDAGMRKTRAHQAAQQCVSVLCAYLRIPAERHPSGDASITRTVTIVDGLIEDNSTASGGQKPDVVERTEVHRDYVANDDAVRATILATIVNHCTPNVSEVSWSDLSYDLRRVDLPHATFHGVVFSGDHVWFAGAKFTGHATFEGARFKAQTSFAGAHFTDGVTFTGASFTGRSVSFAGAEFRRGVTFFGTRFASAQQTSFVGTKFNGSEVIFMASVFSSARTLMSELEVNCGELLFTGAVFGGSTVDITNGTIDADNTSFQGCSFEAEVIVDFSKTDFVGGPVAFDDPVKWHRVTVPWSDTARPPPAVTPQIWPPRVVSS